jgi:hypothetical protein
VDFTSGMPRIRFGVWRSSWLYLHMLMALRLLVNKHWFLRTYKVVSRLDMPD